jgi:hypothetical protein
MPNPDGTPNAEDLARATRESSGLQRWLMDQKMADASAAREQQQAQFMQSLALQKEQIEIQWEELALSKGVQYANTWKAEQEVRLQEGALQIQAGNLGLDYLKTAVEWASTPDNYYKLLDFEMGAKGRQDVPMYLQALENAAGVRGFGTPGGMPDQRSMGDLASSLGWQGSDQQTGPNPYWGGGTWAAPGGGAFRGFEDMPGLGYQERVQDRAGQRPRDYTRVDQTPGTPVDDRAARRAARRAAAAGTATTTATAPTYTGAGGVDARGMPLPDPNGVIPSQIERARAAATGDLGLRAQAMRDPLAGTAAAGVVDHGGRPYPAAGRDVVAQAMQDGYNTPLPNGRGSVLPTTGLQGAGEIGAAVPGTTDTGGRLIGRRMARKISENPAGYGPEMQAIADRRLAMSRGDVRRDKRAASGPGRTMTDVNGDGVPDPRSQAIAAIAAAVPPSTTPGMDSQDEMAYDAIGRIMKSGGGSLGAQGWEQLSPTAQSLTVAGIKRHRGDPSQFLHAYKASRLTQGDPTAA